MKNQEYITYLQEELGAAEYHLWALKKGLYKVYGLNDTPEAWEQKIQALEAELESLLNPKPEKLNLKEDTLELIRKIDVVIAGNTVQVIEPEPEPEKIEKVSEITKDVDGIGEVKAVYELNQNSISVNGTIYREREIIRFSCKNGNASYDLTTQGWLVTPNDMAESKKEQILKVFSSDLDRLGPAPQPDPPKPELQIVNPDEFNFWKECIEKFLHSFKFNSRLRTSWKAGDTCYKEFNRRYNQIWNIPGYQDQLDAMQDLAARMFLNRTPDLNQQAMEHGITPEQLEQAKHDIVRIYHFESRRTGNLNPFQGWREEWHEPQGAITCCL